ncbi:MAG: O-antigen ligase family protein [Ruminococcus sp.]|nr:O-antigen ligase family protein [Ruminococcus sp.]
MTITKTKFQRQLKPRREYNVHNALVNYFLVAMFAVCPLVFSDAYFSIRRDKYFFFLVATLLVLTFEGVNLLSKYSEPQKVSKAEKQTEVPWYKTLSLTDFAFLAFLLVCTISSLFSISFSAAFFGTMGRNNGLLLIGAYTGIYFVISRKFYFKEYILTALAAGSLAVSLLAVVNFYYVDPLMMFTRLTDAETIKDFTSTIGNKNLMASLLCVFLPVTITSFVHTKKKINRVLYFVSSCIGFMALLSTDSDLGLLGFAVTSVVMFIWYVRYPEKLKKFLLVCTVMLASLKIFNLLDMVFDGKNKGLSAFQKILVNSNAMYFVIAVFAVATVLLYLLDSKKKGIVLPRLVQTICIVVAILGVVGFFAAIFYFTFVDTKTDLGFLRRLLRFNDSWGTHRGFMWIRSMWIFGESSFMQKLFGWGPDMFYVAFTPYFTDLAHYGDTSTNCAHNEYINYLITTGIFGLAAYLCIVVSSIRNAVKSFAKNPFAYVCAAAVICYSVQALVNISQPITTPLFILFISLCSAISREAKNGEIVTFDE